MAARAARVGRHDRGCPVNLRAWIAGIAAGLLLGLVIGALLGVVFAGLLALVLPGS